MDILAARKKAAELAKAKKAGPAAPALTEPERAAEEPAFPPLPETEFLSESLLPGSEDAAVGSAPPAEPRQEELRIPAALEPAEEQDEFEQEDGTGDDDHEQETEAEQEREMLAFRLGNEEYVVPVDEVQEVLTPKEITPVPHVPDYIVGVCSLRGIVLPIIDLHRRLGLETAERDEKSRIVVVNFGKDDRIGLYVDRVRGVVRFAPSTVQPVPDTIERGGEFLLGIARKDERLFILLDAGKTAEF